MYFALVSWEPYETCIQIRPLAAFPGRTCEVDVYILEWLGRLENEIKAKAKGGKPQLQSSPVRTLSTMKGTLTSKADGNADNRHSLLHQYVLNSSTRSPF